MGFKRSLSYVLLLVAGACGGDDASHTQDDAPPGTVQVLKRASKSSTIALADDGAHVAMVNPEDGTLSVFQTSDNSRTAKVATGTTPAGVVIAPDSKTAYVANRGDGTVVRVANIDGGTPAVDATAQVGSEPIGLALSPTGKQLFVAEYAESRVSVIDTATMTVTSSFSVDRPRALAVTNNGDAIDSDETLIVASYFGAAVAGQESKDAGRTGHLRLAALSDLATAKDVTLGAIDSGFPAGGVATNPTVHASPNQLGAIAINNGRLFVTSVEASPEGPTRFDNNLFPVIHVADLTSAAEITDGSGTVNLARKIYDAMPTPSAASPRFVPGELADLDFVPQSNVAYAIGRAGDVMVRVTFGSTVDVGSTQNKEIDLAGNATLGQCQAPTGVVIDQATQRAYVNCWVTRRLGVVDLASQALSATTESAALSTAAADQAVQRGRRFYYTGRGRWSAAVANGAKGGEGWSSCGSCHPDGLTDNITWSFGAGPRQTTSQDGTFSHGPGAQKQRMLNWTAINDEHHDFENNTRGVSGGLGAITTALNLADCGQLDKEIQVDVKPNGVAIGGLQKPFKELADDPTGCQHHDWDDITSYVKQITPVHAKRAADPAQIARGRQLFSDGGCAKCHGGAGWTTSRLFYSPLAQTNSTLAGTPFSRPPFFPTTWMYDNGASARTLISGQPIIATADTTGPAEPTAVGIGEAACVLRNVGTFGVPGDQGSTDALEIRIANGAAVRSEGRAGYNVPSLYGLALGAPYLHHGQSPSLTELFTNPEWGAHTDAGSANFSLTLAGAGKVDDLVAFLLSIDASTPEFPVPMDPGTGASFDACPL